MTQVDLAMLGNSEFEAFIAQITRVMGYTTEMIPLGQDVGIDVIARKGPETLAIQVKKYTNRKINLEMVYHTYAACAFYDCTKPVIATLGVLTPNAERAANKLNVEIWDYNFISSKLPNDAAIEISAGDEDREFFEHLWSNHFKRLEGTQVKHLKRDSFIIIKKVDETGVFEISSNGKERYFPMSIFEWAISQLRINGVLTRSNINDEYKKRGSSAISAIIATLPNITIDEEERQVTLKWEGDNLI